MFGRRKCRSKPRTAEGGRCTRQVHALLGYYHVELYLYVYRRPHNFNVPFIDMDAKIRPSGENETPVTAIV